MSDLFDRPQPDNPFAVDRDAARRGLAESNDFWNRQNREQQETNRRRQENLDRYTVRLTDEQYEILNLAIANAEIPEDEAYNMASAVKLSERYGIPLGYARQNLERYRDALFGTEKRYTPKDTFTAIADNWRIGVNGLSLGKLGNELSMAHEAGDPERAAALWEEIQRMRQENESLADHQNRNFFIEALKFGAQSAPFSGAVAGTAIVGSLLAPGAGTAAAFAASMALTRGQEYIDLLEAGAEPERARRTATAVGTIYAAIEMGLGDVASAAGGAVKLLGKKAVGPGSPAQALAEKLTAGIFKKLHFSGTFKRAALRIPLGYAFGALEEGVEEVLQELTSAAALQAAASLQGEGVDAKTARELGEAVGEAFRGGLMGSLVLGLPGTFLNSAATIQDTNKLIAAAKTTPSDEAFRKDTAGNKLFEGMSDERREAAQDEIRARYEKHREQEEARIAADIKARGSQLAGLEERAFDKDGEETTPGVYRNPDGSLYTRIEDEKREGGVITGSFRMGDGSRATESNTYGAIDYRIENDALNITGVHVVDHRRELTEPFYQDFAKKFAGTDIRWEADAEADRELRDRLVRNNRRGPEAGLNYFENAAAAEDETYRIRLDRQIQEHARLGADEREAWIQLWEAAGERNGLGLRGTFERVYADPENIFSDTLEGARAAQAKGREIKGATFWRDTEKGLRAVVYVAKNGDFSTLSHESLHAYREALKGIDPGLSAEIDQALDSNVTREPWMSEQDYGRAREEYLVKNFENYLYNGAAPEPALKTLFDRIAAFMRRIYSYLSGKQAVSPEIQNVFDRIFAGYDARQGTARNGPNGLEMRNAEGPRRPAPTPPEGISERPGRDDIDVSGVPVIREQYQAAKKTYGRNGTINVNGERLRGRYVVAEAGTFASSHTRDFRQTPNFPRRADGSTVNDNDYENRPDAQESTLRQGSDFDQRGMGIVGTRDGIIVSGNGRNIAAQIAAARGTNTKYLEDLRDNSEGYGLTTADLAGYRNPELVFELEDGFDYSTESFAQFNVSTQKAASPMETAIKMAKRLAENPGIIQAIANTINEHETLSDLYNDRKAVQEIFNILQKNKITGEYERPQYADEQGQITGAGEDLLESVLLGAVLNERNIRRLRGAKAVRQKLVRGITALVENKAMGDYSLIPELHEAAGIALAVNATAGKDGKRIYGTVQDYVKQQILPGMPKGLTVEKRASIQLAEALESGGQKDFALWFGGLNASRAAAARGQAELFTGAVESKESILDRYAGYRDDLAERKRANRETLADPAAGPAAKAEAALDDAGIAGAEAAGTLLQTGDEANPAEALINRAGSMLEDPGEREQGIRELRELERLYPPETNRYLAPNGKPSLLLEALGEEQGRQAWYAVRTPSFKKWFGDWETAARIEEIEKSGPVKVTINAPVSQKEAEKIAASFGTLQNQSDGKATELPIATIGKIIYHQGFDVSRIIRDIPALYNTSIQGWTEQEIPKEGHKSHPNIQEYRHYINKFTDGTDEYYIRFTVTEEKTKPGKTGRNLIHSSAISEVSVYKNGDDSQRIRLKVPGEANSSPFIDKRLQQF
ncbi:MAG: hypothetical protein LBT87_01025, partial [Treponema sp.]|nr:hypothetical protein [Treponema sp.]